MFEVGKTYEFRIIEGGDEWSFSGAVEKYEHPLLKLADTVTPQVWIGSGKVDEPDQLVSQGGVEIPGKIINVTSPNFVSAVVSTR